MNKADEPHALRVPAFAKQGVHALNVGRIRRATRRAGCIESIMADDIFVLAYAEHAAGLGRPDADRFADRLENGR